MTVKRGRRDGDKENATASLYSLVPEEARDALTDILDALAVLDSDLHDRLDAVLAAPTEAQIERDELSRQLDRPMSDRSAAQTDEGEMATVEALLVLLEISRGRARAADEIGDLNEAIRWRVVRALAQIAYDGLPEEVRPSV